MANPAVQRARSLAPGDKLGKHELIRQFAVGGMAELYLARTTGREGLETLVVLKRVLPQLAGNPSFVTTFLHEARLAATLQHPNIARVFDVDQDGADAFFSTEYIHGQDLGHLIASANASGMPISLEAAVSVVASLCAGLHYAHEKVGPDGRPLNVVHRDVSPSNVLIGYDGVVKLVDFGIARAGSNPPTARGDLKGKIAYMSPEQCRGKATIDRRSDVFSIGTILYQLTTGRLPFTDETEYGILNQIVNRDAEPPSRILPGYSPVLEAIVMRALARSPDRRYATALELQKDLEGFARENQLRASPPVLARLMDTLYPRRREEWDHARAQGAFFVEQHVERTLLERGMGAAGAQLGGAGIGVEAAPAGPRAPRRVSDDAETSPLPGRGSSPAIGAGQVPRRPSEPTMRAPAPASDPGRAQGLSRAASPMPVGSEQGPLPPPPRMSTPSPVRLPTPVPGQPGAVPIVMPMGASPMAPMGAPPMAPMGVPPMAPMGAPPMPAMGAPPMAPMGAPPMPAMGAPPMPGAAMAGPSMAGAGTLVTSQQPASPRPAPMYPAADPGEVTERVRVPLAPPQQQVKTLMVRLPRRRRAPAIILAVTGVVAAAAVAFVVLGGGKQGGDTSASKPAAVDPSAVQPPAKPDPAAAGDPAKAKADDAAKAAAAAGDPATATAAKQADPAAAGSGDPAKTDDPATAKPDEAAKAAADEPSKADDVAKAKPADVAKPDDAAKAKPADLAKPADAAKAAVATDEDKPKADAPKADAPKTAKKPKTRTSRTTKQTRGTSSKKDPKKTDPEKEQSKWTPDSPFMPVRTDTK